MVIIEKSFLIENVSFESLTEEEREKAWIAAMDEFAAARNDAAKERKAVRNAISLTVGEKNLMDLKDHIIMYGSYVKFDPYSHETLCFIRRLAEVI